MGVRKGIRVCDPISAFQEVEDLLLKVPADLWRGWGSPGSRVALHLSSRSRTVIWRDFVRGHGGDFARVIGKNLRLEKPPYASRSLHSDVN